MSGISKKDINGWLDNNAIPNKQIEYGPHKTQIKVSDILYEFMLSLNKVNGGKQPKGSLHISDVSVSAVCPNCGAMGKKTCDGYWCNMCHNEFS